MSISEHSQKIVEYGLPSFEVACRSAHISPSSNIYSLTFSIGNMPAFVNNDTGRIAEVVLIVRERRGGDERRLC
ncbi:MAG TPA: hypothetical protein VFM05_14540 [Candidatus Saccharimonadales bacterium]|nr:hypothetical protein [Candidatus Saccharimonadales bacterium]